MISYKLLLFALIIASTCGVMLFAAIDDAGYPAIPLPGYDTVSITFRTSENGDVSLTAYHANTLVKKFMGLGNQTSLPRDKGMVFTFDSVDSRTVGMRWMEFPIDIIFVSDDGVVNTVVTLSEPQSLVESSVLYETVECEAKYIIEVNAGWTKENNITHGTEVHIDDSVSV